MSTKLSYSNGLSAQVWIKFFKSLLENGRTQNFGIQIVVKTKFVLN